MMTFVMVLVVTLAVTAVGLAASVSSLLSARQELSEVRGGDFPSADVLEVRRHFFQQAFRATKLTLLAMVTVMALIEMPPDPDARSLATRSALVVVVLMISGSAVQERYANRKIVQEIKREQQVAASDVGTIYQALVESNPWGVLAVDEDFNICHANASMERLCGWSLKELQGQHLSVLIPEEERATHAEHEREYVKRPRLRHGNDPLSPRLLRRDGTTIAVEISLAPINSLGRPHYYASVRSSETLPEGEPPEHR